MSRSLDALSRLQHTPGRTPPPPLSSSPLERPVAEAGGDARLRLLYDQLLDNLLGRLADRKAASVLLVGVEHQATLVAQLAILLARRDRGSILLVDAAGRQPGVTDALVADQRPGWGTALGDPAALDARLLATATQGLDLLPRGWAVPAEATLEQLYEVLAHLQRRYAYVLLDGGTSANPLARRLGRLCDGTFLLIGLGLTDTRETVEAVDQLRAQGVRLLGCIVTHPAPPMSACPAPHAVSAERRVDARSA